MKKNKALNKIPPKSIFNVALTKQNVICPPDQVFSESDFEFLLTIGGDLVGSEIEFNKLRRLLKSIGETEIYISENLGATLTESNQPFEATITLEADYKTFHEIVGKFDPPFGWFINHFYVYGQSKDWGIYICEYPCINIIGCKKELSDKFRHVFEIKGNGFAELKELMEREFYNKPSLLKEFIEQYKLDSHF